MKKVMLVFGTRPEAIKMCPLVKEFQKHPTEFETIVCVTGQHREMLDQVLTIFDVKPDVMSILVGINDVSHGIYHDDGTDVDTFMEIYDKLLAETKEKLPNIKIMLMEPFMNEGKTTNRNIEGFEEGVAMRSEAVQMLCAKYELPFLSLQFDLYDLEEQHPAGHWTLDGVHPTLNFHEYIAQKWVRAFEVYLNK